VEIQGRLDERGAPVEEGEARAVLQRERGGRGLLPGRLGHSRPVTLREPEAGDTIRLEVERRRLRSVRQMEEPWRRGDRAVHRAAGWSGIRTVPGERVLASEQRERHEQDPDAHVTHPPANAANL